MEPRRPPEYRLELLTDRSNVKDITKALLHTIFFHRYFVPLSPSTHEVLDLTLPYVSSPDITSLIDTRCASLPTSQNSRILVQFLERKRKKATGLGWFGGSKGGEDEQVWENWVVDVTLVEGSGIRRRRESERSLQKAVMKVVQIAMRERGHIPPITTNETNPFPFTVVVNPQSSKTGEGRGFGGIF